MLEKMSTELANLPYRCTKYAFLIVKLIIKHFICYKIILILYISNTLFNTLEKLIINQRLNINYISNVLFNALEINY